MNRCTLTCLVSTVAVIAFSVAGPRMSSADNLLTNPGFEDGGGSFDGWTPFEEAHISTVDADSIVRSGVAAAKVFGKGTDCPTPVLDVSGFSQSIPATVGQIYEFSGYAYVSGNDSLPVAPTVCEGNRCTAKIVFKNLGTEMSSNELIVADGTTPHDEWIPFSVSAPAPLDASTAEVFILFLQPGCDSGATFIDDLSLVELLPPAPLPNLLVNPGFDSGLSGWNVWTNVFHETRIQAVRTPPGSAKLWGPFDTPGATSGLSQSFPATPGDDWLLQVWSFLSCAFNNEPPIFPGNPSFATAKIVFRDSQGGEIGFNEVVIADSTKSPETWTCHMVNAVAPPGAVAAEAFLIFIQPDSSISGNVWVDDVVFGPDVLTSTPPTGAFGPRVGTDVELRQNVPNPFGSSTRIEFVLRKEVPVDLGIYDVSGRHIKTLVEKRFAPGTYAVTWDGTTRSGEPAAAGVYRCVIRTLDGRTSRSMMLLR